MENSPLKVFHVLLTLGAGYYLWALTRICLHELGHVVVGKMAGFNPYAVTVGRGTILFRGKIFGILTTIHRSPLGGLTYTHLPKAKNLRWRGILFSLAGIAFELPLLWYWWSVFRNVGSHEIPLVELARLLFFCHIAAIIANLLPHDVQVDGKTIANDGKQFWQYLMGKRPGEQDWQRQLRLSWVSDPNMSLKEFSLKRVDLGHYACLIIVHRDIAAERFVEATEKALVLLDSPLLAKARRAWLLNALAHISLTHGQPGFHERALNWSDEARALVPKCPALHSSYGAALVQNTRWAKGIEILTPLTAEEIDASVRSFSACYLAKACHHLGYVPQSEAWLNLSKEIGRCDALCSRIEAELKGEQTPASTPLG